MDYKRRLIFIFLAGSILQGCASQTTRPVGPVEVSATVDSVTESANETLLEAAGNYPELINLYRNRLATSDDLATQNLNRQKLAQTYLTMGDIESTLFYCEPVLASKSHHGECLMISSRARLANGEPKQALALVLAAQLLKPNDPKVLNQLGLVYADTGRYDEARASFNRARLQLLDDVTARNNLAVDDMLEQNWQQAADRLLPLFYSGQADDKVRANLLLSLAQSERAEEFSAICDRGETVCKKYYHAMKLIGQRDE